ncbi:MAG: proliferating cell nuclear antigen (pcna) [Candidatus Bathyarchaeota archaeon]|nr:proliferating cell nuclear antigen (pcna) [Candidatus Bathyarchaeota archaeon]
MFRIRISDTKTFRSVLDALSTIVDEATFTIGLDGIRLRAMDPSRVAMVDFEMRKTSFDEYEAAGDSKVCVNLNELKKLIKRAGKDDTIELSLNEESGRILVKIKGRYTRTFSLPVLEASEEEVPEPKLAFNAKVTLTSSDFNDILKDVEMVSDSVRIEADGEKFIMNARGDVAGAEIEIKKGDDTLISIEAAEPSKATFSLSYLADIVKAASDTSDIVTLEFSTDMPLRLDFRQRYDGKLVYLLAPRIEVE